jgi:GMP synthase (glutamine-hydrolysing)
MGPLILFQTGPADPEVGLRHGDYGRQFAEALDLPDLQVHDATSDAPLPHPSEMAGVVITGSAAMVTDRLPWSERLAEWLRAAVPHGVPVFGVCYGHQLLAHAFGGTVDWNPDGPHLAADAVTWDPIAGHDPVMAKLAPVQFYDHSQQVTRLPEGAVVLATTPGVSAAAFRLGPSAWGVQFHPEWSPAIYRDVLRGGAGTPALRGADPETAPLPSVWPGRAALLAFRAYAERRALDGDARAV